MSSDRHRHPRIGRVVRIPPRTPPTGSRRTEPEERFKDGLAMFLEFLVPLRMSELTHLSEEEIAPLRIAALEQIASHGDVLQYGGKGQREARTALVTALAILASAEGGIDALGVHACAAPHAGCPANRTSDTTPESTP